MKNDQDGKHVKLLDEALSLLNESDAKTACALCEAASREGHIASPDVCRFLDSVASVAHARLLALEGSEHVDVARDGVELPREWSAVEWPTTFGDLDFVRQLFYRWATDIASETKAYFFRMIAACATARAGRVKKEMRELRRMVTPMPVWWEEGDPEDVVTIMVPIEEPETEEAA